MKRTILGTVSVVTLLLVLSSGYVFGQSGGSGGTGTGSGGAGSEKATGSATSGSSEIGAASGGAQSGAGAAAGRQSGASGNVAEGVAPSSAGQITDRNLLLDRPGAQPPSQGGTQGIRPFDGQQPNSTDQPNQVKQNSADVSSGGRGVANQDRSLFDGSPRTTVAQRQRDLLSSIGFAAADGGRGLVIETLGPGSIFFESGFRPGDVVVAIGGQPITSEADFRRMVINQWGQRIPATVLRGRGQETIYISFPEQLETQVMPDRTASYQANRPVYPSGGPAFLGVGFDTGRFDMASVRDVLPGSAAEQAGLRVGDVIVGLNGQRVGSFSEVIRMIRSMRAGDTLQIEYTRRMPNRAQAVLSGQPGAGPNATAGQPIESDQYYRGEPRAVTQPRATQPDGQPSATSDGFPNEGSGSQGFPPPAPPADPAAERDLP